MDGLFNVVLRTLLVLFILFVMLKLMGKKQVSQMNMFDYITGITIGSIVADISLDIEKNLLSGIVCLLIYFILSLLISYLSLKSIFFRDILNGKEVILMENGKILRDNLSKNKITINILETEARLMGYFNLDEINNAILEPNGKISFDPKEGNKTVNKKDILSNICDMGLVYNIIIDGEIVFDNLKNANINIGWLNKQLKISGKKKEDIILLTIDSNKKLTYYLK